MSTRDEMDAALKGAVIPALRSRGFKGSLPHFRRPHADSVDLLTFQFDKWGGGFVIEIARGSKEGFTTHWGKHIPANKLTAWDLHPNQRKRIQPREGSGTDSWFRFEGSAENAANEVLECLPKAETWWSTEAQQGAPADRPVAALRRPVGG